MHCLHDLGRHAGTASHELEALNLQMRPGGWTVDLSGTVARFAVASVLIAGVMRHEGLDRLPGCVFPQVLPLLFYIRRARLSKHDQSCCCTCA